MPHDVDEELVDAAVASELRVKGGGQRAFAEADKRARTWEGGHLYDAVRGMIGFRGAASD